MLIFSLAISSLKENFALNKSENQQFFTDCFDSLLTITELARQYLERFQTNFISLVKRSPTFENVAKMMLLSPLLD